MSQDELLFFNQFPGLIPIYRQLKTRLEAAYPELRLKLSKTQISFYNRRMSGGISAGVLRPGLPEGKPPDRPGCGALPQPLDPSCADPKPPAGG